jgi:hypothetical protein
MMSNDYLRSWWDTQSATVTTNNWWTNGSTVTVNGTNWSWGNNTFPYQVVWQWNGPVLLMNAGTKLRCEKQRWSGAYGIRIIEKNLPTGLIISVNEGKVELIWIEYRR